MRIKYSLVRQNLRSGIGRLPMVPLTLAYLGRERQVTGLVDSGAMLNVIPYQLGLDLGATWDESAPPLSLGGSLRGVPAIELAIMGRGASFPPVKLYFAWSRSDDVRVILGQYNFFQHFIITFNRSKFEFEINRK